MQNTVNEETLKSFIQILRQITGIGTFDPEKLLPMVEQMTLMGNLLTAFNSTEDEEELILIGEKMRRCENESKKTAKKFFSDHGVDFKHVKEQFMNPDIIGEEEKKYLLQTKEKFARIEDKIEEPKLQIVKKKKKKNKIIKGGNLV